MLRNNKLFSLGFLVILSCSLMNASESAWMQHLRLKEQARNKPSMKKQKLTPQQKELLDAIIFREIEKAKNLVNTVDDFNYGEGYQTPLNAAIDKNLYEIVALLLSHGADPDYHNSLRIAGDNILDNPTNDISKKIFKILLEYDASPDDATRKEIEKNPAIKNTYQEWVDENKNK
jgi:ankyrin repeat protein